MQVLQSIADDWSNPFEVPGLSEKECESSGGLERTECKSSLPGRKPLLANFESGSE